MTKQQLQVLKFIGRFKAKTNSDIMVRQFMNGYCYHFAMMLMMTFQRGTLIVNRDCNHIMWRDTDFTLYDIRGRVDESEYYKPLSEFNDKFISQFTHVK